ncbi:Autophagy protein 5 [Hypsibius exemplaris]|uniref:Autophagy protein 5 n=1 Tax=Hypsibius exemplaris TaxID=2072580 RepID=A0A9X6RL82_HYPEX|nr:Autophagy protein 5 [Hypsibius exemplaris]
MSDDREILRELWNGQVPVHFVLSSDETSNMEAPQPYFVLVPRQTYFPLCLDKVNRHFQKYTTQTAAGQEIWLDFDGTPLRMHYPVGVLFDLFAHDALLPWTITVHYSAFPEDELIHLASRDAMESYFMSTLKEADALKHKVTIVSTMQKKDHKQLWTGLLNDRFDQFWAINRKLMEVSSENPYFRYIPFRVYQADKSFIQKLVKPVDEEGRRQTLADLLLQVFPDHQNRKVVIQGVKMSPQTPLQWLSEHFSYPDNFIHICVHEK